jgi:hypothetical protein
MLDNEIAPMEAYHGKPRGLTRAVHFSSALVLVASISDVLFSDYGAPLILTVTGPVTGRESGL